MDFQLKQFLGCCPLKKAMYSLLTMELKKKSQFWDMLFFERL